MHVAAFLVVMAMITLGASESPSPQASTFCEGKSEGSYCQNCMQPVYCDGQGGIIEYGICQEGEACNVRASASYCTTHTNTQCRCDEAGDKCDFYDLYSIEHCLSSGPFQIETCPDGEYCYYGECVTTPECVPNEWTLLKPDCTSAVQCDGTGSIIQTVSCNYDEYVNDFYYCSPSPPPACDSSCSGRCPNPIDCSKFVVCDGNYELGSGDCPPDTFFDTQINNCASSGENCVVTDGCVFHGTTTTPFPTTFESDPPTTTTTTIFMTTSESDPPTTTTTTPFMKTSETDLYNDYDNNDIQDDF